MLKYSLYLKGQLSSCAKILNIWLYVLSLCLVFSCMYINNNTVPFWLCSTYISTSHISCNCGLRNWLQSHSFLQSAHTRLSMEALKVNIRPLSPGHWMSVQQKHILTVSQWAHSCYSVKRAVKFLKNVTNLGTVVTSLQFVTEEVRE
jgi:hypothetical protein